MNEKKAARAKRTSGIVRAIAAATFVGSCLIGGAQSSLAQYPHHHWGAQFIGQYRREIPRRYGVDIIVMNIKPDHNVVVTTNHRNGTTTVGMGNWMSQHGLLTVTMRDGMQRAYRLHGPNLEFAGDKHMFYRRM